MPDPTLADIAATIRENAPEALPKSLAISRGRVIFQLYTYAEGPNDELAAAVLRDAMVRSAQLYRLPTSWLSRVSHEFDADHGDSSLLSCFAAWKWARGIE